VLAYPLSYIKVISYELKWQKKLFVVTLGVV
jgi:hypothetical protein